MLPIHCDVSQNSMRFVGASLLEFTRLCSTPVASSKIVVMQSTQIFMKLIRSPVLC